MSPAKTSPTLPWHFRGILHFGYLPKSGEALAEYSDAFLRLYYAACGYAFDAELHARNVAAIGNHLPLPRQNTAIEDPVGLITGLPAAVQDHARSLQRNLCAVLQSAYPLLPGESIVQQYVSTLKAPLAGCAPGTVVYARETNRIRIDFLLPVVQFSPTSGQESLVLRKATPAVHQAARALAAGPGMPSISVIQSVATNLAFALPSPGGAFLAAGVSMLFGTLFAGGDAQAAQLQAIANMIQQAVSELETFMSVTKTSNDVHAFYIWVHNQIQGGSDPSTLSLQSLKDTIKTLKTSYDFQNGSLFNDLVQISTENFVQTNTYVQRAQDEALQVMFMNVSALICAQKLIALLSSVIVSKCMPLNGQFDDLDNDSDYQAYMGEWVSAVNTINTIVNGSGPDTSSYPSLASATAQYVPEGDISAVTNVFGPSAPTAWSGMISDYASNYGWAAALSRLVLHRQMARVLQLGQVSSYDTRHTQCGPIGPGGAPPDCVDVGSTGFAFSDLSNQVYSHDISHWSSGCCDQNSHDDSSDVHADVVNRWQGYYQNLIPSLSATDPNNPTWGNDLAVASDWRTGVADLLANAPLGSVPNGIIIGTTGWGTGASAKSQWKSACAVRYAMTLVDANGNGERSDWTADFPIQPGAWEPMVRSIATPPAGSTRVVSRQIWRQFVFKDAKGDEDVLGVPRAVGSLTDASITDFKDMDHAEDSAGLPAA